MKLSHICLLGVSALMFWACANRYSSPILIERGEGRNEYEREYFAVKESMGIDKRLKDVFKQGYIEEGMTNDMVNLLWGPPDHEKTTEKQSIWEYYTREGELITRLFSVLPFCKGSAATTESAATESTFTESACAQAAVPKNSA